MLINIPKHIAGNEPVPAAIYKAIITGCELKQSNTGTDYTSLELTIQSNAPDSDVKTQGRKLFDMLTWSEAALGVSNTKVKQITGQEITNIIEPGQISVEELHMAISNRVLNREVLVQVTVDPVKRKNEATGQYEVQEGEFRNNIKKYTAVGA